MDSRKYLSLSYKLICRESMDSCKIPLISDPENVLKYTVDLLLFFFVFFCFSLLNMTEINNFGSTVLETSIKICWEKRRWFHLLLRAPENPWYATGSEARECAPSWLWGTSLIMLTFKNGCWKKNACIFVTELKLQVRFSMQSLHRYTLLMI